MVRGTQWQVNLRPAVGRLVEELLGSGRYRDVDELFEKALLDRYDTDATSEPRSESGRAAPPSLVARQQESLDALNDPLLHRLESSVDSVEVPPAKSFSRLPFLMNRLNPTTVVVRVIGNLEEPRLERAVDEVGRVGRQLGLRLRALDADAGVTGSRRRSVSWPVSDNVEGSKSKFVESYLCTPSQDGGILDLGLARVMENHIVLTSLGVALAAAESPLLEETSEGRTLGSDAKEILRDAVLMNSAEVLEIRRLMEALEDGDGKQGAVDEALRGIHADWTESHVASHRSAMVGRLRDVGVLNIEGRGPTATITVTSSGAAFADKILAG